MTVRYEGGAILLEDECGVEEAEILLTLLQAHPVAPIDWSRCRSAHTAVLQLLLAAGRTPSGQPADEFLGRWMAPALAMATRPTDIMKRPPARDPGASA